MREVSCNQITEAVKLLCIKANIFLPPEVGILLECAAESESSPLGQSVLNDLVENFKYAAEAGIPICQDTGMAVVFADVGQEVHITGGILSEAVNEGVRRGYEKGYLRKSVVKDPLRRENTEDNSPAVLHLRLVEGDKIDLSVMPKGFGSENMSSMRMFLPGASVEDIEGYVVETVLNAGAKPCPPIVLGIGLGGTCEQAALIAKRALLRPIDTRNPNPFYAGLEERLLHKINSTGLGPQGFGGDFTALAVNIETYPTHIAGLPCVVNFGCHATRHAEMTI